MQFGKSNQIGSIGEHLVASIVMRQLGWIYRLQHEKDIGIDGEIELVDVNHLASGQIVKVQVKAKESFEDTSSIYINPEHFSYWQKVDFPVIICAVSIKEETAIWWHWSEGRKTETKYAYDLAQSRPLNESSRTVLEAHAKPQAFKMFAAIAVSMENQLESLPHPASATTEADFQAVAAYLDVGGSALSFIGHIKGIGFESPASWELTAAEVRLRDVFQGLMRWHNVATRNLCD